MLLTYKKFEKSVPKETFLYVNRTLPILEDFLAKGEIRISDYRETNQSSIILAVLLHTFYTTNSLYASLLTKYHFDITKIKINTSPYENSNEEDLFKKYSYLFCMYAYEFEYQALTPATIVNFFLQSGLDTCTADDIILSLFETFENKKNFANNLKLFCEMEEKEKMGVVQEKICEDLPIDTIHYLENASQIYQFLDENKSNRNTNLFKYILKEEDTIVLSLFLGIFFCEENTIHISEQEILVYYFSHYEITLEQILSILKIPNLKKEKKNQRIDYFLIHALFSKFTEKEIEIDEIVNDLRKREFTKSIALEKLFSAMYQDIDILKDTNDISKKERKKFQQEKMQAIIKDYGMDIQTYLENVSRVHMILENHMQANDDHTTILEAKEDIQELSMLIALFHSSGDFLYFFQKNGMSLENILACCNFPSSLFQHLETVKVDYDILFTHYLKYLKFQDNKYITLHELIKNIFDSTINDSVVLEKIMAHFGESYALLKEEILTGKEQKQELTLQEYFSLLYDIEIPKIDIHNFDTIITFGNALTSHSLFINKELPKLYLTESAPSAISLVNQVSKKMLISSDNPKLFFSKWNLFIKLQSVFNKKQEPLTHDLAKAINQSIANLSQELIAYNNVLNYLGVYHKKNYAHLLAIQNVVLEVEKQEINPTDEFQYADLLSHDTYLNALKDKQETFATSNIVIKQQLLDLNQMIRNHSLTLKALTIARDDLLPIIETQFAILMGRKTEKQAFEIYTTTLQLCQSLLLRNAEETSIYLEKLKQSSYVESFLFKIESDIVTYFNHLQSNHFFNNESENPETPMVPILKLENPA